jgi:NAD(P)-dependent dehydrogenase (short-subunit alcohol dehydrogenase family)
VDQRKTVLISGASGGLGSATARRLDTLGWQVFAGVRDPDAGEQLARSGEAISPVSLDICDEGSIARAREEVARRLGGQGLDALVNNAGIVVQGPLELLPVHALRRQFEVSVIGHVAVTQAFLPLLRIGGGRVVNIGGAAGRVALPMLGAISAAKAALESLTDTMRMELVHQGVDVSIVTPGLLKTRIHEKSAEASRRDGLAGDAETQRLYARALGSFDEVMGSSRESDVDVAVEAIVAAVTARRPAPRYVVGRDAKQLVAAGHLPERLRDRLLMWKRGLRRDAFTATSTTSTASTPRGAPVGHGR